MAERHDELAALAEVLAEVGRRTRDAVRDGIRGDDGLVLRNEGGDDVFGVDERADAALLEALVGLGDRWPGRLVIEGRDDRVEIGDGNAGPWVYLADPVDGTRPFLAGKRSAWVLLGAGRDARTLEDLEVGAMVEIPTARAAIGRVMWAAVGGPAHAVDDDLVGSAAPTVVRLEPRVGADLDRSFVTVMRFAPGDHGPIGAWADGHLAGLEVYDDLSPCGATHLAGLAAGSDSAVFDPRPILRPGAMAAHPYDLASLVVPRAAGVIIEALPPGPLDVPIDTSTDVAWAGYANQDIADRLRPTDLGQRADPVSRADDRGEA